VTEIPDFNNGATEKTEEKKKTFASAKLNTVTPAMAAGDPLRIRFRRRIVVAVLKLDH
jgi:hypothetical protein